MSEAPEALPDLDVIRPLILEGLAFAAKAAKLTATAADDNAIEAAIGIVNGPLFGLAYRFIDRRLSGAPQSMADDDDLTELAAVVPAGIPLPAILALIQLAMEAAGPIWAWIKERRKAIPTV